MPTPSLFSQPTATPPNVSLFTPNFNSMNGFFAPALMNLIRDPSGRAKITWGNASSLPNPQGGTAGQNGGTGTQPITSPFIAPPTQTTQPSPGIGNSIFGTGGASTVTSPGMFGIGGAPAPQNPNVTVPYDDTAIGNGPMSGGFSGGPVHVPADLTGLVGQVHGQSDPHSSLGTVAQGLLTSVLGSLIPGGGVAANAAIAGAPGALQTLAGQQNLTAIPNSKSLLSTLLNPGANLIGPALANAASNAAGNGSAGADAAGLGNATNSAKGGGIASTPAQVSAGAIGGGSNVPSAQAGSIPGVTAGTGSIFQVTDAFGNPGGDFAPMGWNANPGPMMLAEGMGGSASDAPPIATHNAFPFFNPATVSQDDLLKYFMQQNGQK